MAPSRLRPRLGKLSHEQLLLFLFYVYYFRGAHEKLD